MEHFFKNNKYFFAKKCDINVSKIRIDCWRKIQCEVGIEDLILFQKCLLNQPRHACIAVPRFIAYECKFHQLCIGPKWDNKRSVIFVSQKCGTSSSINSPENQKIISSKWRVIHSHRMILNLIDY